MNCLHNKKVHILVFWCVSMMELFSIVALIPSVFQIVPLAAIFFQELAPYYTNALMQLISVNQELDRWLPGSAKRKSTFLCNGVKDSVSQVIFSNIWYEVTQPEVQNPTQGVPISCMYQQIRFKDKKHSFRSEPQQ